MNWTIADCEGNELKYGDLLFNNQGIKVFVRAFEYKGFYFYLPNDIRDLSEVKHIIEEARKNGLKNRDLFYENLRYEHLGGTDRKLSFSGGIKINRDCLTEEKKLIYDEVTKLLNSLFIA